MSILFVFQEEFKCFITKTKHRNIQQIRFTDIGEAYSHITK